MMDKRNVLINKKILYAGTRSVQFKEGCKVHFNFKTHLLDENHTLIDDSKHLRDGKPFELVLGKKFKMEVWEVIIQQMALGEVAIFTVDKQLVLEYPLVSKTLRDMKSDRPQRHMCAMTLQTSGLGYEDLNRLMRKPTDLEFTMELVGVDQPDSYEKDTWQMTSKELKCQVPELKERGNQQYKLGNHNVAAELYMKALGILETFLIKEQPNSTEWLEINKTKVPFLLNLSQCRLIDKEYYEVIQHCTEILKFEPNCTKAYYRRAKAHMGAWNPDLAENDFRKALSLDPTLNQRITSDLNDLNRMIRDKRLVDKSQMSNLFNTTTSTTLEKR